MTDPRNKHTRRDGNERKIIDAWTAAGCFVQQMSATAGFDLLIIYQGMTFIVEVKQPGGRLTPAEKMTQSRVIIAGGKYYIITSVEDALEMIRMRGEYDELEY